jgi:hypothetical protein
MKDYQLASRRQLQRIAAIPYNPYLKKEVYRIRKKYGVGNFPSDREKLFPEGSTVENHQLISMGISRRSLTTQEVKKVEAIVEKLLQDKESSLERDIALLMSSFRLPYQLLHFVVLLILVGQEKNWRVLAPKSLGLQIEIESALDPELPALEARVSNIRPWTTSKDWAKLWDQVRLEMERVGSYPEDMVPESQAYLARPGRKRSTLEAYKEQMKRYSEWYELSNKEGPEKALMEWEQSHPELIGKFDTSTLSRAVQEFRQIITPKPPKQLNF